MIIADISISESTRTDGKAAVFVSLALDGPLTAEDDAELLARIDAAMAQRKIARVDALVSAIQDLPAEDKAAVLTEAAKPKPAQVGDADAEATK